MQRALRLTLGLLLAAAVLPLFSAPASAAAQAPTLLSPSVGQTFQTNPVFTWQAAPGVSRYRVQVATDSFFSANVKTLDTVNLTATFNEDLPNGTLFWRAFSFDDQNVLSSPSPFISFVKKLDKPTPSAPVGSQVNPAKIAYPQEALQFSWQSVPNTQYYVIEIDDDKDFTPPVTGVTDSTVNPTYTWSNPNQMNKTLYWHVKAVSPQNQTTEFSDSQAFAVQWTYQASLQYPAQDQTVEEVRFDWSGGVNGAAVPGATAYNVIVSSDSNFNTIVTQGTGIQATAWEPRDALPASDYYWKVIATNASGVLSPESAIGHFKRVWPTADESGGTAYSSVALSTPADNAKIVEPNFSWTPARLGSSYQFWSSTDPAFSPGTYSVCTTTHNSITPYAPSCPIYFSIGTTYYWKVKPVDLPTGVLGVFSPTRHFLYNPEDPTPISGLSPANGFSFTGTNVPLLSWNPFQTQAKTPVTNPETDPAPDQTGFGRYLVRIFKNGALYTQTYTYNTSYVPALAFDQVDDDGGGPLPPHDVTTSYSWEVVLTSNDGHLGLSGGNIKSFSVQPRIGGAFTINTPAGTAGVDPPALTWNPVTGAARYEVMYGVRGTGIFDSNPLSAGFGAIRMNGYVPERDNLTTGQWDYYVRAYNNLDQLFATSSVSWFQINEIPATNLTSPRNCTETPACTVQADTPTLDWDPVPNATHYLVSVATDVNFTNILHQYDSDTQFTKLRLVQALPDNQAGSNSYYWYARPCVGNRCAPGPETFAALAATSCYHVPVPAGSCSPIRSFVKSSNPIVPLSPANNATATDEIKFHWEDYLLTNRSKPTVPVADQEAATYYLEVATTANFQAGTGLDAREIDGTTYIDEYLYPNGPVFWRVRPRDGSGNLLPAASTVQKITKTAPVVTLATPLANAAVKGVPVFKWNPQPYAFDYTIEVYKNPALGPQPANLMNIGNPTTQTPAFAPRQGLPAGTYGWRVKYRDARSNEAGFTALRQFTLTPDAVTLVAPDAGKLVAGNRAVFTWQKPTTNYFSYYRFELSNSDTFTSIVDAQATVTNAYAPPNRYSDGTWYWRVALVDGSSNTISVSDARMVKIGQPGSTFKAVSPTRLLDSRLGTGPSGVWGATKLVAGTPRSLQITGGIIPANATAVIANVTATGSSAASFLTVYPADENTPNASNVNFGAGQTIPNLVTVKLSSAGAVKIATAVGSTDVILDVVGYFDDGTQVNDSFTGIAPVRILDSREAAGPWSGTRLQGGTPRTLKVSGAQGIPANATSAVLNVTVTGSTQASFLTVYGSGAPPTASNLNFGGGETIPNLVVTPLNNTLATFYTPNGATHVIVDVVGYFSATGEKFHFMSPTRILDSRTANQAPQNAATWNNSKLGTSPKALTVAGVAGVPTDATSVIMNTTATGGSQNSFVTVYPDGTTKPNSSNLNFGVGQTIPNLVMVKLGSAPGSQGKIDIANANGTVDIIGDVVGYFAAQ